MRILVYKRTHNGDPDARGHFGAYDCMGAVRDWVYDAVIGVGGAGREAQASGISGQVNWIGIGPHKTYNGLRGPVVTFDHYLDFGTSGPDFRTLAPTLAERIYADNIRAILHGVTRRESAEARAIVELAVDAPPSVGHLPTAPRRPGRSCRKRRRTPGGTC